MLNKDKKFAESMMKLRGMDKFFVEVEGKFYGTLFFYELYFNDIENIWLICSACNLGKSNHDPIKWLKEQWLFGPEFIDYLGKVNDEGILKKVQSKKGLALVAINWFWDRHANYITTLKKIEGMVRHLKILNKKVDVIIGAGKVKRAQRYLAHLDFRTEVVMNFLKAKGFKPPRTDSESVEIDSQSSDHVALEGSDSDSLKPSVEQFRRAADATAKIAPSLIRGVLKEELRKESMKNKKGEEGSEKEVGKVEKEKQEVRSKRKREESETELEDAKESKRTKLDVNDAKPGL